VNSRIRPLLLGEAEVPNVLDVFWSLSRPSTVQRSHNGLLDRGERRKDQLSTTAACAIPSGRWKFTGSVPIAAVRSSRCAVSSIGTASSPAAVATARKPR
jgi:hypothetical protein